VINGTSLKCSRRLAPHSRHQQKVLLGRSNNARVTLTVAHPAGELSFRSLQHYSWPAKFRASKQTMLNSPSRYQEPKMYSRL